MNKVSDAAIRLPVPQAKSINVRGRGETRIPIFRLISFVHHCSHPEKNGQADSTSNRGYYGNMKIRTKRKKVLKAILGRTGTCRFDNHTTIKSQFFRAKHLTNKTRQSNFLSSKLGYKVFVPLVTIYTNIRV